MPKLRTLLTMQAPDRVAALEALTLLTLAKFLVHRVPPRSWRERFGAVTRPAPADPLSAADEARARVVARAVRRGVRNGPAQTLCLPQALAARWMLERRGIPTSLHIGVLKKGREGDPLHAWLRAGDYFVTGHCEEDDYLTFG